MTVPHNFRIFKPPFDRPKKQTYPPRPRCKAVTIGIGFKLHDGIVLAADRQITFEGSHKYQEEKIRLLGKGSGWQVLCTYSGTKLFSDLFCESVSNRIESISKTSNITTENIRRATLLENKKPTHHRWRSLYPRKDHGKMKDFSHPYAA